ncbi:unnamed protein product [Orchesella dallaii]|uniref:G domain-containing protein n=1 Tax=Orchesella dallaii TaxID=48710 RepID=A0ABP1QCP1_9HEXA
MQSTQSAEKADIIKTFPLLKRISQPNPILARYRPKKDVQYLDEYTFNCVILGSTNVGKSTYCRRLTAGTFAGEYQHTQAGTTFLLHFQTSAGLIHYYIRDTSGAETEKAKEYREARSRQRDCAILMLDMSGKSELYGNELDEIHRNMLAAAPDKVDAPTVVVGAKYDLYPYLSPCKIPILYRLGLAFFVVSSNSGSEYDTFLRVPFLEMTRQLLRDPNVHFMNFMAPPPI